jgi:hypothetical protein
MPNSAGFAEAIGDGVPGRQAARDRQEWWRDD